jgi:hypothetical protein
MRELIDLWLELVAKDGWLWPQSSGADGEGPRFEFFTENPVHERVATASCMSELNCTLQAKGEKQSSPPLTSYVSVSEIMSLGVVAAPIITHLGRSKSHPPEG